MDLDGIHAHTALNHRDSYCLKFKTNTKHGSTYIKFKAKYNAGKNKFVKYDAKIGNVSEDLQN